MLSTSTSSSGIICVNQSNPVIDSNAIDGGNCNNTHGVYIDNADGDIRNNLISGGSGSGGSSYGIYIVDEYSGVKIRNNTLSGGSRADSYGIFIDSSSGPAIENNIIFIG